ncbi:MAG: 2-amino-4-hydroxy-6-hydroxymethyldihydropteridine diphosphokinase [Acidimicrobiales bacterium]|nr:2-amino-4-hydroxy-6-hydroxymethyldihydropteridine diphosphokinase [Acidimicrobiales bacterium]
MTRAFLGLGSNVGDRESHLRNALASLPGLVATSDLYETDPVGGPDQGRFLNLVAQIDTDLGPHDLLGVCHRIESAAGRVRDVRWGPRTLDVDILWIDGVTIDTPDLTIPHPRMWERRFVLEPLAELDPTLVPDGWDQEVDGRVDRLGPLS